MCYSSILWFILLVTIVCVEAQTMPKASKNKTKEYTSCGKKGMEVHCTKMPLAVKGIDKDTTTVKIRHVRVASTLNDSWANDTHPEVCPTWMFHNLSTPNQTCHCGSSLNHTVSCNSTTKQIRLLDSYCMTHDQYTGAVVGECLLGCYYRSLTDNSDTIHYKVPSNISQLNDMMCGPFNRTGQLCGQCKEGLSPTVYSYNFNCKNCTESQVKNWMTYIAVAFLPLTLFYLFVVIFKFNANAPHLNGFIFVSQILSNSANLRVGNLLIAKHEQLQIPVKVVASMYGIWSLDFFREFYPDICLDVSTLTTLAIDYAVAFYPLLLIGFSYFAIKLHSRDFKPCVVLGKPFLWCASHLNKPEDMNRSMIDVFATFLHLSYARVMTVSFDLLLYTRVRNINGTEIGHYLYYAPTVEYFQSNHLPYAITALFVAVCISTLPFCVLLFYPMQSFQKCLNYFKYRHQGLHIFADSFHGCYKDGTNGTKDCRYFAAWSFFIRFLLLVLYAVTLSSYFYAFGAVVLMGNSIVYIIFRPYKVKFQAYNTVDASMYLIAAMWYGSVQCAEIASVKGPTYLNLSFALSLIISILPLVYISVYIIMRLSKKLPCCVVCAKKNKPSKESSNDEENLLLSFPDRVANPNRYHGSMDIHVNIDN